MDERYNDRSITNPPGIFTGSELKEFIQYLTNKKLISFSVKGLRDIVKEAVESVIEEKNLKK